VSKTVKAETSSFMNKPLDTLTSDNSSSSLLLNLEPQSNAAASLMQLQKLYASGLIKQRVSGMGTKKR
jgi:hypothetical protein